MTAIFPTILGARVVLLAKISCTVNYENTLLFKLLYYENTFLR